jgi:hypothetical protein
MQSNRDKQKRTEAHSKTHCRGLDRLQEKKEKIEEPFSLFRRGRWRSSRQVSWLRLYPTRRAFPSFSLTQDSDLLCGFRGHHSGGTAPDLHRTSLTPWSIKRYGSYNEKNNMSRSILRVGHRLHIIRNASDKLDGSLAIMVTNSVSKERRKG